MEAPEFGELYDAEEFAEMCKAGLFNDYDGSAEYWNNIQGKDIAIRRVTCDELATKEIQHPCIVWYSK